MRLNGLLVPIFLLDKHLPIFGVSVQRWEDCGAYQWGNTVVHSWNMVLSHVKRQRWNEVNRNENVVIRLSSLQNDCFGPFILCPFDNVYVCPLLHFVCFQFSLRLLCVIRLLKWQFWFFYLFDAMFGRFNRSNVAVPHCSKIVPSWASDLSPNFFSRVISFRKCE